MELKNKIFVRERLAGKTIEEAAEIAGIAEKELLSAKRAEAGRKGGARAKQVQIQEQLRKKNGRERQAVLDQFIVGLELPQLERQQDRNDLDEMIHFCKYILEDFAWGRVYTHDPMQEYEAGIPSEEWKNMSIFPDAAVRTIADHIRNLPLTEGLTALVRQTLEQYLQWESQQSEQDKNAWSLMDTSNVRRSMTRLQNGENLFEGWSEDRYKHSQLTVPEQLAAAQAKIAEYERIGRSSSAIIGLSQIQLAQEAAEEEFKQQQAKVAADARSLIEAEKLLQDAKLRALSLDAWKYLRG